MAETEGTQPAEEVTHQECHRGILRIAGALPAQVFPPTMSYTPLGGRVWTASEGIYRTIFIEGDSGIIAFDTFYTPGAANSYRQAIKRVFPLKDIQTIVYSHDHLDHTGYAIDLAPEANVIAHERCAEVIAARKSDGQAPATETWSGERKAFEIDGVSFELIYPGQTHGNGNVAAYLPDNGLLFMVDTVIPGVCYTFIPDWHLSSYVPTMRRLLELDGWDRFVPGHFWPVDRAGFAQNLDYYDRLAEAGQQALIDGVDSDDYDEVKAYAEEKLRSEFGYLFRFHEYIGMNLMRYMLHYRTGGWGLEDNSVEKVRST